MYVIISRKKPFGTSRSGDWTKNHVVTRVLTAEGNLPMGDDEALLSIKLNEIANEGGKGGEQEILQVIWRDLK